MNYEMSKRSKERENLKADFCDSEFYLVEEVDVESILNRELKLKNRIKKSNSKTIARSKKGGDYVNKGNGFE